MRRECVAGQCVVVPVRVDWDDNALDRMLGPDGIVGRDNFRRTKRVENGAKRRCPVRTGRLRASIQSTMPQRVGNLVISYVYTDVNYGRFVHDGTGIYGPRRAPIVPVNSRFLVFTPDGASSPVFARSVKGSRPQPFLTDALPAAVT